MQNPKHIPSIPALLELACHAACKAVQDALGQTDGGLASMMLGDENDEGWLDGFYDYLRAERGFAIEEMRRKAKDTRPALARIKFYDGQCAVIGNSELALYGLSGDIISFGPEMAEVRLDDHFSMLDEWDNVVQFHIDGFEFAAQLLLDPTSDREGFFLGVLSQMGELSDAPGEAEQFVGRHIRETEGHEFAGTQCVTCHIPRTE